MLNETVRALSMWWLLAARLQSLLKIRDQVRFVLDPDRHAHERIRDAIDARRSAPISKKIVCAAGNASVRVSPRLDDRITTFSASSSAKQSSRRSARTQTNRRNR
jgi:chaperonin GroEL (HSP60 family)